MKKIFSFIALIALVILPVKVKAEATVTRSSDNSKSVKINVVGKNGKPVSNARVTVYTNGAKNMHLAYTNDKGQAVVTMPANLESGYMTVTGPDVTPIVDQPIKF